MKRILVTGSNGQLGTMFRNLSEDFRQFAFTFIDIQDLDLTQEGAVQAYLNQLNPDYIINCAAYTAVDKAESQPNEAFAINASVPACLGQWCNIHSCKLIQVSTDYIYKGSSYTPHAEDESPAPMSVYGKSKLQGELSLTDNPHALIIRTSWLYSEVGNNFLRTMIRLSKERNELGVVFDQTGTPTYALDLASAIMQIISHSESQGFKPGIFNYSNEGVCSWFDFSTEIMKAIQSNCMIRPIKTADYKAAAQRPEYSVLDKKKLKETFGIVVPYWRDSMLKAIANLKNNHEV
jgi:dTDP-4-dehydrorhamnose reductase